MTENQLFERMEQTTWEERFRLLTEAIYNVRQSCCNVAVLAIFWLHPKHPVHFRQRELMKGKIVQKKWFFSLGKAIFCAVDCFLYAVWLSLRLLWLRWNLRREIRHLKQQPFQVVAKTWCFDNKKPENNLDFYYGNFQHQLLQKEVKMLLLCGDANDTSWISFAKGQIATSGLCRIPELVLIPILAPFRMVWKQWIGFFKLSRFAHHSKDALAIQVAELARFDCLNRITMRNGLFYWIGQSVAKIWAPSTFVALYEGHGWEKCAWLGVKKVTPSCKTVGYQHSVIMNYCYELYQPSSNFDDFVAPDIVLCTGTRSLEMMQKGQLLRGAYCLLFGSFRCSNVSIPVNMPAPERRTLLVLPEGILTEAVLLFNLALSLAQKLPEYRFVFRCHPVLPFSEVLPHLDRDPKTSRNVEISPNKLIEDDFMRSSAVLYRGSSSVLYAVMKGLKPFYFHKKGCEVIDPVFELKEWREYADSEEVLEKMLVEYAQDAIETVSPVWEKARNYVQLYTMPVEHRSIEQFLTVTNL